MNDTTKVTLDQSDDGCQILAPSLASSTAPVAGSELMKSWTRLQDLSRFTLATRNDLRDAIQAMSSLVEDADRKISERKTVHTWLNAIGTPDTETTGKPMCLLRRLAVQLGVAPHQAPTPSPEGGVNGASAPAPGPCASQGTSSPD